MLQMMTGLVYILLIVRFDLRHTEVMMDIILRSFLAVQSDEGSVGSTTACLEDGCLTFNMYDFGEMAGTIVTSLFPTS